MLVKLGNSWVDPAVVISIRVHSAGVQVQLQNGFTQIVYYGLSAISDIIELEDFRDEYAAIVNEALAPKQSWPDEITEAGV